MPVDLLDRNAAPVAADSPAAPPGEQTAGDFIDEGFAQLVAAVGTHLQGQGYRFTPVTPASQQRVLARDPGRIGTTLRDIFGWNLPFACDALPPRVLRDLDQAGLVLDEGGLLRSRVRFATIDERLHVHDGLPADGLRAVTCDPDGQRFATAVRHLLRPSHLLVDVGCGAGMGGLAAGGRCEQVVFADTNPRALAMAGANSLLAGRAAPLLHHAHLLNGLDLRPDAIIAHPMPASGPLATGAGDGTGDTAQALRIIGAALDRLAPGGQLILATTAPIVAGRDALAAAALPLAAVTGAAVTYSEVDPDVHGELLALPGYRAVERLAAVVLTLVMPG